ncbi:MAG: aldehyde dehydrogenase family protein [Candidatus Palauibacterales bacterium]|nr:aldehyde dehydrogenase family protein [Candidatus Palauibacterales bacterium]MDP2529725.1 aldehyde dehydrogenase family protein [Candidatus Palauibacterales bacterium]MDP2584430.1 aldehyde dehydrogenase family protein [Candidatus Palauibacterales bacterium]
MELRTKLLVGGDWVDGADRFADVNPATEETLAQVHEAGPDQVDAAVRSAREALPAWRDLDPHARSVLLWRLADLLEERAAELAVVETLDNGKPSFESAKVDLPSVVENFRYYAGWADKLGGETIPVSGPFLNYTLRQPVGVVGAIIPWNFPLSMAAWKVAPALACGNAVILKPAEQTPLTALLLGELALEAGFPAGVLNVIPGRGPVTGQALVEHPGVDKISFTGSVETGKLIMREAAATVKNVTLELGGKSPNVVFADADLDAAARGATTGIFYGKGEVCAAGSRLYVERSVKDAFMEKLLERTAKMVPGDPTHPKTRLGALVSKEQRDKVLSYIEAGREEGATLRAGGEAASVDGRGYFVEATVFDDVDIGMKIAREEIFGPVVAVLEFDGIEDAIRQANQTIYGLAAGVWTRDVGKAHRFAREVQAGTVWVNTYNRYDSASPFGGVKQSGFGRDLGRYALEQYTETKSVWVALDG